MSMKRIGAVAVVTFVLIIAAACSSGGGQAPAGNTGSGGQAASATVDTSGGQQAAGTESAAQATPAPGQGGPGFNPNNFAAGQVKGISGSTITLTTTNGTLTVDASDQTQIQKLDQGSLSDIQVGQRITVRGARASDGTVTAQMIQIGGQFGGRGANAGGTPRARRGTPGPGRGGAAGAGGQNGGPGASPANFVAGQVQQISGNTITLTANGGTVTVNAGAQTQIRKLDQATLSDIQAGQRITAQGSLGSDGTFTAQMIQIGSLPMGGNPPSGPTPTSSD